MPKSPTNPFLYSHSSDTLKRIRLILDINSNYIKNKVDNSMETYNHLEAVKDGELIAEIVITQHGLNLDRYLQLNQVQRDYVSNMVSTILKSFCDHLEKLTHFTRIYS